MPAPIALQLYTVREAIARDYEGVVRKVADIGYVGVEPAGFPGTTPEAAGKLFRELGLAAPSAHLPIPLGDRKSEVIDTMNAIGATRIVSGFGPDRFATSDLIRKAADEFNAAAAAVAEHGMSFGIHNHWWEFEKLPGGRMACDILLERLRSDVFFEIDTYWAKTAGADPAEIVRRLGARAPLLHIKDGPCVKGEPQTAVGDGIVDFEAVAAAGRDTVEWMIVELDACATDMMEAVEKSHAYLMRKGLACGR